MTTFTIDGSAVDDIASLYGELNRVFMADEDWRLGPSLDALNDLLYGGYGALRDADGGIADDTEGADGAGVRVVWSHHEHSRRALGRHATAEYYRDKLAQPQTFDTAHFRRLLDQLESGEGATYFDIVLEVFAEHPRIEVVLA